ncbi:MAG: F0F1 ATP synthase subunit epsilon [Candidatus Neomarinimicrobiota bacterium]
MKTFKLEIVTPSGQQIIEAVSYVRCPGLDGSFGIMAGHRNAMIALGIGEIKVTSEGLESYYATSGGFAEISSEKLHILVETMEHAEEIKLDRAKAALERGQKRLRNKETEIDDKRAEISINRAKNRVQVSKR